MRTNYGVKFGREDIISNLQNDFELEDFSTKINEVLSFGSDFRTIFVSNQNLDGGNLFQMQGDLYFNFKFAKNFNLYVDKGLRDGYETFLNSNFQNINFKLGHFLPNYGLKIDDHTTFIRRETEFSPVYRNENDGVEFMLSPISNLNFYFGIYGKNFSEEIISENKFNSYLEKVEYVSEISDVSNIYIGGNHFKKNQKEFYGGFLGFTIQNGVIFTEFDWIKENENAYKNFISYTELDYTVLNGVDLKIAFDYFKKYSNKNPNVRYTFGFEIFPIQGIELRPLFRINKNENLKITNEIHFLVHIYI